MARKLDPAQPRGTTWNGAGGWVIASQSRQENFSRTVWTTFHWRGITSSVSVTSSPSFDNRAPPHAGQAQGAGITTRSRGRCSGKALRAGRLRSNAATPVVFAAAAWAASSSSLALASSSSSCSSSWSSSRRLRAGAVLLAPELGDEQLQVRDQGLVIGRLGGGDGKLRLDSIGPCRGRQERCLERFDIVRNGQNRGFHEPE